MGSPSRHPKGTAGLVALLASAKQQERLRRILRGQGYDVRVFSTGSGLLLFLKEWIPEIVLVDVWFSQGNYAAGLDLIRKINKMNARRGNSPFPVMVCLSALRHPRQEEELRRLGVEVAWLSAPGKIILDRIEYALHLARSMARTTPHFRIIFENPDASLELTEKSVLQKVVLVDNQGREHTVPLTFTPLLIFVYLLLRRGLPQDIDDMRENLNSIPFYSSGSENRIFTYDSIKTELHRIRLCLEKFLGEHGFSFSKVWVTESLDGDERTTGMRIIARHEIDVRPNETMLAHGFKL
jgi:CheY-like chemotaxis protein